MLSVYDHISSTVAPLPLGTLLIPSDRLGSRPAETLPRVDSVNIIRPTHGVFQGTRSDTPRRLNLFKLHFLSHSIILSIDRRSL